MIAVGASAVPNEWQRPVVSNQALDFFVRHGREKGWKKKMFFQLVSGLSNEVGASIVQKKSPIATIPDTIFAGRPARLPCLNHWKHFINLLSDFPGRKN